MSFEDEIVSKVNSIFHEAGLSMKLLEFWCVRPVYDSSYENYEVIHDINRLFDCHPLNVIVYLSLDEKKYEYRVKYSNRSSKIILVEFQLTYADYTSDEDPKEIEEEQRTLMGLVFASVIPETLRNIYNTKNEE